ncbi:purine nucleoside phosphorylase LACC1 [Anoplopoma fimbria]|uniref:purine nucleoside phosphorylase LACC1 n=1 Tax=Anoplopoma fimbria TaxID=229290 RepID=UPI0023ECBC03|nr:purine nucleoside phosphorylase LACC1 [Anoplopoma fimbria]
MPEAVLVDLVPVCGPGCSGAPPLEDRASPCHVFLLCGDHLPGALPSSCLSVHVLASGCAVERLYRFKQGLDRLGLSSVRVLTTPRRREQLVLLQQQLFTAAYTFHYRVHEHTCPRCAGPAPSLSPAEGAGLEQQVSGFLQQLPALRGPVGSCRSLRPSDCFGHGFSTRSGGISYIPTLSSLNLFHSRRRRDPPAVVQENRRRLGLHAGFHPQPLRLVKVDHGSHVWVVGRAEPESYDAMVTDQTGVVIAAPGADCMPILFADPVSKVIGAAHAGWKGTLMGVAMATVGTMVKEFGCRVSDIVVAVGPAVGGCCFTLDREQALDFYRVHQDCVPDPESTRPHVNIRLANRVLLQRGGVLPEHIHDDTETERSSVTPCTSCHPEDFFSHTRDGLNFGTQLGFMWIRGTD